jgi:hypothetical protein
MCNVNQSNTIEFSDDDYIFKGTRAQIGSIDLVVVDINHPNYGYFAEYMAFWRSPHSPIWTPIQIHSGSYNIDTDYDLIQKFPQLSPLFSEDLVKN